jgi:hypothetical protein
VLYHSLKCDSPSVRPPAIKPPMLWRSPSPTRHPPGFIEPCLPTLARTVPTGPQWAYGIKHDGFGFICRQDGDQGACVQPSRPRLDRPSAADRRSSCKLRVNSVALAGEGVVCRRDGVSDFDRLRAAVGRLAGVVPWPPVAPPQM